MTINLKYQQYQYCWRLAHGMKPGLYCDPVIRSKLGSPCDCKGYQDGDYLPNYPMPAIPVRVGWQPTGTNECKDRPYWWVCSMDMLWTFWKDWGLVAERKDGIQIN